MPDQDAAEQRLDLEQRRAGGTAAASSAQEAAARKMQERLENPEFFEQLRDFDLDTDEHDFIEEMVGPLQSGAHLIANRSPEYEKEAKWLDRNRAERMVVERTPGRLCKGKTLEIAQGATGKQRDKRPALDSDQRRALRDAMEVVTNVKTLGIETAGLSSVTEATAVSRVEKNEEETKSRTERAADLI